MRKSKISFAISVICLVFGVLGIVSAIYLSAMGEIKITKIIGTIILSVFLISLGILDICKFKK